MAARTIAGKLAEAFGDVETMAALYAPDVCWYLPASTGLRRPYAGKAEVVAFNRDVWSKYYRAEVEVTILDEVGDDRTSAARFLYKAYSRVADAPYENEYALFVRSGPEGIVEVNEMFDTQSTNSQIAKGLAAKNGPSV